MTSITLLTDINVTEVHVAGCRDLKNVRDPHRPGHYRNVNATLNAKGETLADAIIAADTEMAEWFGEEPYTEKSRAAGCWSVTNGYTWAPCFTKAVKAEGIIFDEDGRPSKGSES